MGAALGSKDIVFAFFGVFLSIIFSQGLFRRIVSFVSELSYSVIPFGYSIGNDSTSKLTKEQAARLNQFQVERARKMKRLEKSISCNASVAMTLLIVACSVASFKIVGATITNFQVTWGLLLTCFFVYATYYAWSWIRDDGYWRAMPPMSVSRYNILLTIAGVTFGLYALLLDRGAFALWIFYLIMLPFIYFALRMNRVPQINITHRRAVDFEEDERFYLHDIGKETVLVLGMFTAVTLVHFFVFDHIQSLSFSAYLDNHPVRSFLVLVNLPFLVFLTQFMRVVGYRPLVSLLFYVPRTAL